MTFRRTVLLFSIALGLSGAVQAQTSDPVSALFHDLAARTAASGLPPESDLLAVNDQVAGLPSATLRSALRDVATALAANDGTIQAYAGATLFAVSLRADNGDLLSPYVGQLVTALTTSGDRRVTKLIGLALINVKPAPAQIVAPLVAFVGRSDVAATDQLSAVAVLLGVAPNDVSVNDVTARYLARTPDLETRLGVLQAIRVSSAAGDSLRAAVAGTLDDPRSEIQLVAINTLTTTGADRAGQVMAALNRAAQDASRLVEVRDAADRARRALAR